MDFRRFLIAGLFAAIAQLGLAVAQNPLVGSYLETQIGFMVVFEQQPDGLLTGSLWGANGAMPLDIQADFQNVQGSFMLEGTRQGFAAQLQPDSQTLLIWLYSLDAAGQPLTNTYEQYTAIRQQATPTEPPAPAGQPVGPALGAPENAPALPPAIPTAPPGATPPPLATPPAAPPADSVMPAPATQPLVGHWQGTLVLQGLSFDSQATFNADGTFREEVYLDGQPVAWYSGTYVLDANGQLQQTSTDRSPQACIQGQCAPNDSPALALSRIDWLGADTFLLTSVPQDGTEPTQIQMQRVQPQP